MKRPAFTMIELLIVIVILGALAALIVPNILEKSNDARKKIICLNMETLSTSLDEFKLDNGKFPETTDGLKVLTGDKESIQKYKNYPDSPYLKKKQGLLDPWKNEYIYVKTSDEEYDIFTLGADAEDGGSGSGSDIKLSDCRK